MCSAMLNSAREHTHDRLLVFINIPICLVKVLSRSVCTAMAFFSFLFLFPFLSLASPHMMIDATHTL